MARVWLLLAVVAGLGGSLGCRSPYYSDRGAVVGGLTGAGVGAALGDASGNAGPGAAIGAAIGALTGNAIGESIDADLARSRAQIEARMGRQMAGAVTSQDVIAMTQAGLSEDVISTHVRANGVARRPDVNELIYLRNSGVSDGVIGALQQAPQPGTTPVVYAAAPPREVLVEHYYGPPWYACPPPRAHFHHHPRRHHHHPGVSWGFSFAN
jgi:outer membrane lipoprotein SlyB